MDLFKKFVLFILSIQVKIIKTRLSGTVNSKISSKRKNFLNKHCLISFDSVAESERKLMEEEMELILKSCNFTVSEVLEYIKAHNTNVYYIKSSKILNFLGEKEGFIYPQKGLKALLFSVLYIKKIKFKLNEIFLITSNNLDKYYFIYHFYNWYSFKKGIEGLNADSIKLLNKYLDSNKTTNTLQLSDIIMLKDAIRQDKNAIDFVLNLCRKYDSSKKVLQKLKEDGANI